MRLVLTQRPLFYSIVNLDKIGNKLKVKVIMKRANLAKNSYVMSLFGCKSRKSAAWVPSCGLRNIQDHTQHDRCLLRLSLLAATTAMIAAAEVTMISSLSAISTSNLCFCYHATAEVLRSQIFPSGLAMIHALGKRPLEACWSNSGILQ